MTSNQPLAVGVVGCGTISRIYLENCTASPLLREVALAAGADLAARPARLSRAAVENLFSRLTSQAHRPGHADPALPQRPDFAAALLILREALHHWGSEWIDVGG